MAFQTEIDLYTVSMHIGDSRVVYPLLNPKVTRIDESHGFLADQFANALQKDLINEGKYLEIFKFVLENDDFSDASISIPFKFGDKKHSPSVQLDFTYIYQNRKEGVWAAIPALGIEVISEEEKHLATNLEHAIRSEFSRNKRMKNFRDLISVLWFSSPKIHQRTVTLNFKTPKELNQKEENKKGALLSKAAKSIVTGKKELFGRTTELEKLKRILKGNYNKNVLVIGPSGVGKSALIMEVVRRKREYHITNQFWETTASVLIKELTGDTGWENNLNEFCRELNRTGDFLVVRNFLELFEVGQYEGNSLSMGGYLKEFVARGEVNVISECTNEEFAHIELHQPHITQLFQTIKLQTKDEEAKEMIAFRINALMKNKNISIEHAAVLETVLLKKRFTPYSGFPGKPIRFLESIILNRKAHVEPYQINRSKVIQHFCEETGMPPFMVDPEIDLDLDKIQTHFSNNIFGQEQAVENVVDMIAKVKTAMSSPAKPIASMLFVGPTGVGKTEMAKVMAQFMFGSREHMIRFDMSEYGHQYAVSRLTGESFYSEGLLTSAALRDPFSVILFDEIEKAHASFYDLLLQLLGEGRLTDSRGRLINFCSTIIIMTSNIGAQNLQNDRIGWQKEVDTKLVKKHFMSAVQKHFKPELFNRIDKIIAFDPLSQETVKNVVSREIDLFKKREGLAQRNLEINIGNDLLGYLARKGYDPKYGARQLQRCIRNELIIPLANKINTYNFDDHLVIDISLIEDKPDITIEFDPLKIDLLLEELERSTWSDQISDLRRSIHQLKEGRIYIEMLSKLDILNRLKEKTKEKFWSDKKDNEDYSFLYSTRERTEEMILKVEEFELEFVLSSMGLRPFRTKIIDSIREWEKQFLDLKMEIYDRVFPESGYCRLGVYGRTNSLQFGKIYFDLLEEKELKFECYALWFRREYYEELLANPMDEDARKEMRKEYVKQPLRTIDTFDLDPLEYDDVLVGVVFELNNRCIHKYFEEEAGLQQWQITKKQKMKAVIEVTGKKVQIPVTIHQPVFFEKRIARRKISVEHFNDSNYNINREIQARSHSSFLLRTLESRFSKKLDQLLN